MFSYDQLAFNKTPFMTFASKNRISCTAITIKYQFEKSHQVNPYLIVNDEWLIHTGHMELLCSEASRKTNSSEFHSTAG